MIGGKSSTELERISFITFAMDVALRVEGCLVSVAICKLSPSDFPNNHFSEFRAWILWSLSYRQRGFVLQSYSLVIPCLDEVPFKALTSTISLPSNCWTASEIWPGKYFDSARYDDKAKGSYKRVTSP